MQEKEPADNEKLKWRKSMKDYLVRATAGEGAIRAFAVTSRNMVEEARNAHKTSPVITAALGRLLSGAAMMGAMMKGEKDLLTVQIQCDGPVKGLTVTADANGHVKGYPRVSEVYLPPNAMGKLDVGGAVGSGTLYVTKDMGLKEPYVGQTALTTGEIAEDLTCYFAASEQIPSAVGLGVLVNADGSVRQAGGFISPEDMLVTVLGEFGLSITDTMPAEFRCDCSKERVSRAVSTLSKKDLEDIINDGEAIEVKCQFCNRAYHFSVEELKEMRGMKA